MMTGVGKKSLVWVAVIAAALLLVGLCFARPAYAADQDLVPGSAQLSAQSSDASSERVPLYRLYNPDSGEHHYTLSWYEASYCFSNWGWAYEGIAWYAPKTSSIPVYRLYNPESGLHHYTTSAYERDVDIARWGWNSEGIAWYSDDAKTKTVYRLQNSSQYPHAHHYTLSATERNVCINSWGWKSEGVGWYALS